MNSLRPSRELSKDEVEQGLSKIIFDGITTPTFVTLTGGIFLIAFALEFGATNIVIGLLAAIPPLAKLVQIPAVGLIETFRNRRLITVFTAVMSRGLWVVIAIIPFLFSQQIGIYCLVFFLILYSCISSVKHCSWKSWMRGLIPDEIPGMFFSCRMALSFALATVLSLCASFFLDLWQTAGHWNGWEKGGAGCSFSSGRHAPRSGRKKEWSLWSFFFTTDVFSPRVTEHKTGRTVSARNLPGKWLTQHRESGQ